MIQGDFEGRTYLIEPFPTDDGGGAWFVQRDGGERHEVRIGRMPSCTCGDWTWRRDGLLPTPCKHVRAARAILKASNE